MSKPKVGGIVCQGCGESGDMSVKDSRSHDGYIRRRRVCVHCGHRQTTVEISGDSRALMHLTEGDRSTLSYAIRILRGLLDQDASNKNHTAIKDVREER